MKSVEEEEGVAVELRTELESSRLSIKKRSGMPVRYKIVIFLKQKKTEIETKQK